MGLVVEGDDLVKGFKLEENNKLVTQTAKIPVLPTVLDLQAVGEGCALVQFSLRYNVARITSSQAFDLNIDAQRLGSSNCNLPRIGICMRYKIPDQTSNMVVVSVKMASGFLPDEWSLYELQSDSTVLLMRHEVDGNQVNLYFNELTNDQKCFQFFIKSELEVDDIKPSTIKLYDYYQPDLEITKEYTIPSACVVSSLPQMPTLPSLLDDLSVNNNSLPPPLVVTIDSANPSITFTTTSEGMDITEPTQSGRDLNEETTREQTATTQEPGEHLATDDADSSGVTQTSMVEQVTYQLLTSETANIDDTTEELATTEVDETTHASEELVAAEAEGSDVVDGPTQEFEITDNADVMTLTSEPTGITDEKTEEPEELAAGKVSTVEASTQADITGNTAIDDDLIPQLGEPHNMIMHGIDDVEGNELEMSDDANVFERNERHLGNFVDLDEDLDFPDGIEGNVPVTVLPSSAGPPYKGIVSVFTELPTTMGCPVCTEDFPDNFTEIYCSSTTLRIAVRDGSSGAVKVLHDLSHFLPQPKPIKRYSFLEYDRSCPCPQLYERGSIHLITGSSDLWDTGTGKRKIHLTHSVHVIKSTLMKHLHELKSNPACSN